MSDFPMSSVTAIAAACAAADGTDPIDEFGWMTLRRHPESVTATTSASGFALGYRGQVAVAVHPEHRSQGTAGLLLARLLDQLEDGPLEAWSHGHHPAASALAERFAFAAVRELWVMRRSVTGFGAPAAPGGDVRLRSWRPGDGPELLRINAAAFADHPEQGAMDAANLAERMAEDWFRPEDLLIAEDSASAQMLGFHWTKRHSATEGEVYVVGVAPQAQGRGLGRTLTSAGLAHLAGTGITDVHLYVESDNASAVAVYTGLGFTHAAADTHVMYRRG